jgi:hypothetical protein
MARKCSESSGLAGGVAGDGATERLSRDRKGDGDDETEREQVLHEGRLQVGG